VVTSNGNYIDAAVMAALSSQRLKTPILLAGAQVPALADALAAVQLGVVDAMGKAEIKYTDRVPFDWACLVDALYGAHVVQRQP
jgi:hypothetical protein